MPALAIWIAALIGRVFASRLGMWVVSALAFLGLQFAVHRVAVQPMMEHILSVTSGLSAEAVQWMAFFNLDKYISIIVSAYAVSAGTRLLLQRRAG